MTNIKNWNTFFDVAMHHHLSEAYIKICYEQGLFPNAVKFGNEIAIPDEDVEKLKDRIKENEVTRKLGSYTGSDLESQIIDQFLNDDNDGIQNHFDDINNPRIGFCDIHGILLREHGEITYICGQPICPKCLLTIYIKNGGKIIEG